MSSYFMLLDFDLPLQESIINSSEQICVDEDVNMEEDDTFARFERVIFDQTAVPITSRSVERMQKFSIKRVCLNIFISCNLCPINV